MNVLIVEDEPDVAMAIEDIVEDNGHDALGPASTIEMALAFAPRADVALVDLGLADGTNGSQLARRLIDRYGITVIFVTGNPEKVQQGFDGAFGVLAKPFSPEKLSAALSNAEASRSGGGRFSRPAHRTP